MSANLIMCISKNLTDLCLVRLKIRITYIFVSVQYFSSEDVLIKHRADCLVINGKHGVKLKSGTIKFKNYFKQLPVP